MLVCFLFKQKTAYEMRISDWSSDVCSSDLADLAVPARAGEAVAAAFRTFGEVDGPPFGGRLSEQQRGAARRVCLVPMVHLDDLDIIFGAQPRRRLDRKSTRLNSSH